MTAGSDASTSRLAPKSGTIHYGALSAWLLIQFSAIVIAAIRFPLSARFPPNGEQFALVLLLMTQAISGAALCPSLLRNAQTSVAACAVAWPIAFLAAFLADVPIHRTVLAELHISCWLIGLFLWMFALPIASGRSYVSIVATLIACGGPLLWYLHADFVAESGEVNWPMQSLYGPAMGSISQVLPDQATIAAWWFAGGLLFSGLIAAAIGKFVKPKRSAA